MVDLARDYKRQQALIEQYRAQDNSLVSVSQLSQLQQSQQSQQPQHPQQVKRFAKEERRWDVDHQGTGLAVGESFHMLCVWIFQMGTGEGRGGINGVSVWSVLT